MINDALMILRLRLSKLSPVCLPSIWPMSLPCDPFHYRTVSFALIRVHYVYCLLFFNVELKKKTCSFVDLSQPRLSNAAVVGGVSL